MKNVITKTSALIKITARFGLFILFAVLLFAGCNKNPTANFTKQPVASHLASIVPSFTILSGKAVTLTDATVNGDVFYIDAFTETSSTYGTIYQGSTSDAAYTDFLNTYNALAALPNGVHLIGTLSGVTLSPGTYYFDAAATLTGTLTLNGSSTDTWIFKIGTGGTGALTGTGFTVVMKNGETCNNNVYWWVAEAATMTDSHFLGTILAGAAITVTGGTFNGNAYAKAAVTVTGATISSCGSIGSITPPPTFGSIKVTGGGEISVSNGSATFGFNAQPDKKGGTAKGEFNYVNHVTGLHINGSVDYIAVTAINTDLSPKTVLFSGTYNGGSFIVTIQDNGEPGRSDQFGVTIIGSQSEVESMNVISNGNIQFHK